MSQPNDRAESMFRTRQILRVIPGGPGVGFAVGEDGVTDITYAEVAGQMAYVPAVVIETRTTEILRILASGDEIVFGGAK